MKKVKVKTNAGNIGFVLGMLAILVWAFFGNVLQYNFRRVSLYNALTSDALMSANGLGEAWPGGIVLVVIALLAIFIGSVVGLLFHMAAGTKTVLVQDQEIQSPSKLVKKMPQTSSGTEAKARGTAIVIFAVIFAVAAGIYFGAFK